MHTGYIGQLCELKLNLCLHSQYCITSHAISCVDKGDNVTCTCADGWAGNNCGVNIDECESHKCLNGAKCVDGVNGYNCKCRKGFTGLYCEGTYKIKKLRILKDIFQDYLPKKFQKRHLCFKRPSSYH